MEKKSNKIKELRIKKNLSQEELSENSGVSLRTIQRLENGETEARGQTLQKLANVFNVHYESIATPNKNNLDEKKMTKKTEKNPWLIIIALAVIGGNIGYLIGTLIFLNTTIFIKEVSEPFIFSFILMFGAIGVVIAKLYVVKKQ